MAIFSNRFFIMASEYILTAEYLDHVLEFAAFIGLIPTLECAAGYAGKFSIVIGMCAYSVNELQCSFFRLAKRTHKRASVFIRLQ